MENDLLFQLIRERLEIDEIIDLCDIEINELCFKLRGNIFKNRAKFESYLDIYDEGFNND